MTIKNEPKTWRELQEAVGEIMQQCNFTVEIEKKVDTIRGSVEIDVYAHEIVDGRTYTIIGECKYWKASIPQNVIHALRTVVNDSGVNKAYIITTSKFQSGALDFIKQTNIELVTWQEFQNVFFKSWYINYFSKKLKDIVSSKYNPAALQFFENFEMIEKHAYRILVNKYDFLQDLSHHFPSGLFKDNPDYFYDIENKLPIATQMPSEILEEWELFGYNFAHEILNEICYSEFILLVEKFATPVYQELDKLNLEIGGEDQL